jgi:hypothetical protein
VVLAVIVAVAVVMDDGHLVFLTDDPAIHLSIVQNLVHHGTWGVVPGRYESASSSPGWTLLLTGLTVVLPPLANALPLLANVAAGVWLVWIFTTNQRLVDPRDRSWSAIAVAIVLGVLVLYIPALALLGMEHTLQCALVLYAFLLLERLQRRPLSLRVLTPLLVVLFLGSMVRFETTFVAIGFAVAFGVGTLARVADEPTRSNWTRPAAARAAVLVGAAAAVPVLALGLVDWSFHRRFFPNSIVAKANAAGHPGLSKLVENPTDLVSDLQKDPLVLACALLAAIVLVWAWCGGSRRNTVLAAAYLVTVVLHRHFADFGWYERYQAYLVVVGVYLAFQVLAELVPSQMRTAAKVSLVLAVLALSITRINLTVDAPRASSNTYRQRYQLGKFFEADYAGQTVATTELGYASRFHRGPIVDLAGLGSHDVLDLLERNEMTSARLAQLLDARHARVLAVFPEYPFHPVGWQLVGIWVLREQLVPGPFGRALEFWARAGPDAAALRRKLGRFQHRLPTRVQVGYPQRGTAPPAPARVPVPAP